MEACLNHLALRSVCLQSGGVDQFEKLIVEKILQVDAMVFVVVLVDEFVSCINLRLLFDDPLHEGFEVLFNEWRLC